MQPLVVADATSVVSGIVCLLIAVPAAFLLGFLLVISPLMVWLNLRRLRIGLHADLVALRESVDRLAGVAPPAAEPGPEAEPVAGPAAEPVPEGAAAPEVPAPPADKIGFSCPGCGKFFEGPATLAGSNYTCSECRVEFHIH